MARILIVEDELLVAETIRLDLVTLGHAVVGIADNGNTAIEIANAEKPELILMDIVLKGSLNGIEISGLICKKYDCKILYMTAHTDNATLEAATNSRHVGFLFKPFEMWQLRDAIAKALGG